MGKVSGVLTMGMLETFGVDNSSSSHADNCRNNFLMLGGVDTLGIKGGFGV